MIVILALLAFIGITYLLAALYEQVTADQRAIEEWQRNGDNIPAYMLPEVDTRPLSASVNDTLWWTEEGEEYPLRDSVRDEVGA